MPSKFTEILDSTSFQSTSPQDDVRLEDILAASLPSRGRNSSEASSRSASSSSNERTEEKSRKRLSRFVMGKR
jgi:hypothetical protein